MERAVMCLLLKNDVLIISEIVEVGSELGEPDCKLIDPYVVKKTGEDYFLEWWLDFTDQNEIMIHSDSILTIVKPKRELLSKYFDITT